MVRNPYRALVRSVGCGTLPIKVLEEFIEVVEFENNLHSTLCWNLNFRDQSDLGSAPRLRLSPEQIANRRVCACMENSLSARSYQAHLLLEMAAELERVTRHLDRPGRLEGARRALESLAKRTMLVDDPVLSKSCEALQEQIEATRRYVRHALRDSSSRESALSRARIALTRDRTISLDETPLVVGVFASLLSLPKALVEVVEAFALRLESEFMVLSMPRYCYDFLQRELMRTNRINALSVAHEAHDGQEVLEITAALWDPAGKGPMSDLLGALEASRLLTS